MVMNAYAIIFVVFFSGISGNEEAEDSLILIHAVIRHGSRTPDPISAFPLDQYKNFSYYPYGNGELNKAGIASSYQFGKQLRNRYNKFLGDTYYPSIVSALSSGSSRCRMTMQLLLAGLFPPNSEQSFMKNVAWQPIPIYYDDCKVDSMLCFHRCLYLIESLPAKQNLTLCKDRNYMKEFLTENSGMKVESLLSMHFVLDTLKSEVENNLELAKWAQPVWPDALSTCGHDLWRSFTSNFSVLAKSGGPLLRKIINDTENKINEDPSNPAKKKLFIYSGHDYNIFILLGILNYYNNIKVDYLSCFIFELHKINDVYGFKVFFDNQDGKGLQQLEVPTCGSFCPLDQFYIFIDIYLHSEPC